MGRRHFLIIGCITLLILLVAVLSPFLMPRRPSISDIVVSLLQSEGGITVLVETLNDNISLTEIMQVDIQNNICYLTPKIKNKSFFSNRSHQSYELDINLEQIDAVYLKYNNHDTQLLLNKVIN